LQQSLLKKDVVLVPAWVRVDHQVEVYRQVSLSQQLQQLRRRLVVPVSQAVLRF
jgi:hypothetical protein